MDYIEESEEKEISDDSDGEKNEESDYSLHFFFFAELYKQKNKLYFPNVVYIFKTNYKQHKNDRHKIHT